MGEMKMAKKVDENQPEIVKALRQVGAFVKSVHEVKNAWDIVVVFRGSTFLAEIKNPEYAPKRKPPEAMLTPGERECKERIENAGGIYHIWLTANQALEAIGAIDG